MIANNFSRIGAKGNIVKLMAASVPTSNNTSVFGTRISTVNGKSLNNNVQQTWIK